MLHRISHSNREYSRSASVCLKFCFLCCTWNFLTAVIIVLYKSYDMRKDIICNKKIAAYFEWCCVRVHVVKRVRKCHGHFLKKPEKVIHTVHGLVATRCIRTRACICISVKVDFMCISHAVFTILPFYPYSRITIFDKILLYTSFLFRCFFSFVNEQFFN